MIEARVVALWRGYIRRLRTDKRHVGVVERSVRALLLVVPYYIVDVVLLVRALAWGPLTVDGTTEDGIHFRCRLPDIIALYVYLFGTWEPDLAAFLRRRLRPGDTFIDVGANIGCVSALASRLVGPGGTVVAIEPSPAMIAALQETLTSNDLANVRVVARAVSDREQALPLFTGPRNNTGLTATVSHGRRPQRGQVRAAPLGALVSREELATARLIKIDVEGAEDRVLAGMLASADALAADAELVIELSPTWWSDPQLRPSDVLRPFLERGYHIYLLPNDYAPWRYLWPKDIGAPQRLRDLAVLERRVKRLDIVLSRRDADAL
ncbi:FkbM family methyltransferase [Mycobacterium sp. SM1]|uniref:FkbM family methyltransferase n=1 Tax=Mycobacterium sp. SM1 TaxID=2816243 RepID=UPI001BCBA32B|nr:FkbM family methyltransferase [Mycobacterium sp. SM1]MBS4729553.1 FkbM family methyltransferase [Mycobacterium sp. SM1]